MKTTKIIGIISTIIIISNYLGIILYEYVFADAVVFAEFYHTVGKLVFIMGRVGFYYSLIRYLMPFVFKAETRILLSLIGLQLASLIVNSISFDFGTVLFYTVTLLYYSHIILLIIFGIKLLKREIGNFRELKILKNFMIALFCVMTLVFILSAFLFLGQYFELVDLITSINSVYAIPYIFALFFFIMSPQPEKVAIKN